MVLYVLVFGQFAQDEAEDLFELLLALGLHVASHVLRLLLELPLEAGELFSSFIDKKRHGVHV